MGMMMTAPSNFPADIRAILTKYNLGDDSLWEVRRGVYALLHKAVEVIVAREGIRFSDPEIIHDGFNEKDQIVIKLYGRLGHREEWSFGECSPQNNKNQFPWAMAEKRAKDRVALKLIDVEGALVDEQTAEEIDAERLPKAKARAVHAELQDEIRACDSVLALEALYLNRRTDIQSLPKDWEEDILDQFSSRKTDIQNEEAGEDIAR